MLPNPPPESIAITDKTLPFISGFSSPRGTYHDLTPSFSDTKLPSTPSMADHNGSSLSSWSPRDSIGARCSYTVNELDAIYGKYLQYQWGILELFVCQALSPGAICFSANITRCTRICRSSRHDLVFNGQRAFDSGGLPVFFLLPARYFFQLSILNSLLWTSRSRKYPLSLIPSLLVGMPFKFPFDPR